MFQSKAGDIVLKIDIHCFRNAMTLALQWSPDDRSSSAFSLEMLMTTARTVTCGLVMGECDGARKEARLRSIICHEGIKRAVRSA